MFTYDIYIIKDDLEKILFKNVKSNVLNSVIDECMTCYGKNSLYNFEFLIKPGEIEG